MITLNSPVQLFQARLVDQKGEAVPAFQQWLLGAYNKISWNPLWKALCAPVTSLNLSAVASPMTWDTTNVGLLSAAASTQGFACVMTMPTDWAEGTAVYPVIRWEPTTANTGNVLYGLDFKWVETGSTEPAAFTTTGVLTPAAGAYKSQYAALPALDGSGMSINSMLTFKVYRVGGDALDTYPDSALVKEFDLFYQIDAVGSRNQMSK